MITELTAALGAMKGLADVAKVLADVDPKHKAAVAQLNSVILDLQSKLHQAQVKFYELSDAKRNAEETLAAMTDWKSEAARYEMKEIVEGLFVYSLKPDCANNEPLHWICPNCYANRKKSVLTKRKAGFRNYICPACAFEIVPTRSEPIAQSVRVIRRGYSV